MSLFTGIVGFVVFVLSIIGILYLEKCAYSMDKGKPTYYFDQNAIGGLGALMIVIGIGGFIVAITKILNHF
jgi:uncharacterized membrane protein